MSYSLFWGFPRATWISAKLNEPNQASVSLKSEPWEFS